MSAIFNEAEQDRLFDNYFAWIEKYKPVQNHITNGAYDGTMFETYGREVEYITKTEENKVWTLIDNNDGEGLYLVAGMYFVNRLGYFITENPHGGRMSEHIQI
jgi:hypothetical protein